jgi:hypothetical protein
MGLSGNISWIVQAAGFSSKLQNAGPGVFFALLGMAILLKYKPKIDKLERSGKKLKYYVFHGPGRDSSADMGQPNQSNPDTPAITSDTDRYC